MLFEQILPQLPNTWSGIFFMLSGTIGAIAVIYSQFIEALNRRDLVRMIGAFGLFAYAISEYNPVFMFASFGIFAAATIEFIEIYTGFHRSKETKVQEYKNIHKKQNE